MQQKQYENYCLFSSALFLIVAFVPITPIILLLVLLISALTAVSATPMIEHQTNHELLLMLLH